MGTLFVDKLDPQSGTSLELGSSGDTVSVNTGATTNLAGNVTLGASGKTITVPAGATITNNGTQTGFGGTNTPNFHAYNSTNMDNSHNSYFLARFNTESFDTASAYTNTDGNYKFTVPSGQAGKYFFYSQLSLSNNVGVYLVAAIGYIRVNGVDVARMGVDTNNSDGLRTEVIKTSIVLNLSVGDYVQVYAFAESGDANNVRLKGGQSETFFGGYKLIT